MRAAFGRKPVRRLSGFGLLETVLGLALLSMVIVSAWTVLLPSVRDSGQAHHTTQSLALGESVLQRLLNAPFDHQSAALGQDRCDQQWGDVSACGVLLGAEQGEVFAFNDVDDFLGCWANKESNCPGDLPFFPLQRLLPSLTADWANYRVDIAIFHDNNLDGLPDLASDPLAKIHKRIELTVSSHHADPMTWVAYRSNY